MSYNDNNNSFFCYQIGIFNNNIKISVISFLLIFVSFYMNNVIVYGQQSDFSQLINDDQYNDLNIVAVGDFYCNDETGDTIENIISINPELIITTGDHVKDVKSIKCWAEMSEPIKNKMEIAIGNHDVEFKKIYKQLVKYHNLTNPYYSHDFRNIHFISLSTEHPFEEGSKQYEFIKNDLEKVSKNQTIDWIIVHSHKPFYSTRNDMENAQELRDTYHPLFEKYNVDLVISSHNQYYERTYPLTYDYETDKPDKVEIVTIYDEETDLEWIYSRTLENNSIVQDYPNPNYYHNPNGIIFLTVGTAGDELKEILDKEDYYVIQDEDEFGFLNLKLENNGTKIVGEFHSNDDDKITDYFELTN
jgi:hypothetical protein